MGIVCYSGKLLGSASHGGCRGRFSRRPAIPMELTDRSPQRFTGRLGFLSHIRFAFASARLLSSALIFSIRVIASGVRILRVEFTRAPSQKLLFSSLVPFRKRAI
jgi:hypothetical protein